MSSSPAKQPPADLVVDLECDFAPGEAHLLRLEVDLALAPPRASDWQSSSLSSTGSRPILVQLE